MNLSQSVRRKLLLQRLLLLHKLARGVEGNNVLSLSTRNPLKLPNGNRRAHRGVVTVGF